MATVTMPKIKAQGKVTFSEERSKQNIVDTLATVFAGQTNRTAESQSYRRWLPGKSNVGRILLHDNGSQARLLGMKVSGIGKAQRRTAAFLDQQQKSFVTRLQKKQDTWVREHSRRAIALNQMGPKKRQNQKGKEGKAAEDVSPGDIEEREKAENKENDDTLPRIGTDGNMTGRADKEKVYIPKRPPSPGLPTGFGNQKAIQRFPPIRRPDHLMTPKEEEKPEKIEEPPKTAEDEAKKKKTQKTTSTETVIAENLPRIKVTYPCSKGRRRISKKCTPPSAGAMDPLHDDRFAQLTSSLVCNDVDKNELFIFD
ncbi:uncharacterized protein [Ptychodera flava]|uniref:uncharacterized protein n=1 Tax=Ptychodera flava TaxID=63121 RepID=UPI00396A7654